MTGPHSRRDVIRASVVAGVFIGNARGDDAKPDAPPRPFLTPAKDFDDVSRGTPIPHTLTGDALVNARLTPDTWRLQIVAEDKATIEKPVTLDLPALLDLGMKHGVRFLKAMQCNNIARPLGQGLWEGVPLREVLKLCGKTTNARR